MAPNPSPTDDAISSRISRRRFFGVAGGGALLTTASLGAIAWQESTAAWDREADVVVVGSGAAASSAALFAHEAGARVLMLEKAARAGGTTARSAGGIWIPNNSLMRDMGLEDPREDCLRFMARVAHPALYNARDIRLGLPQNEYDLLAAFYDHAAPMLEALRAMGALQTRTRIEKDGTPSPDYYAELPENKAPRGRRLFTSRADGTSGGGLSLVEQLGSAIDRRKIPVLLEHRAARLVVNGKREIVGLETDTGDGRTVRLRARRAVIFGSGGFTANAELCLTFLRGSTFGGTSVPTAEGDFVYMATAMGARLSNMSNAWWTPVILDRALRFPTSAGLINQMPGDSVIQVNALGRRVCSEKALYNERGQTHFAWDPRDARYPNLIQFMIYDQFCRDRFGGPSSMIPGPGPAAPHELSGRTLEGLVNAMEARLEEIADRTGGFRLGSGFTANLRGTIARFNQFAETGVDLDHHRGEPPIELAENGPRVEGNDRPNPAMYPIARTGPYYCIMIACGVLDTKGGPAINANAQVLDGGHMPIRGLYGAGNCVGSPMGQAHPGGGATIGLALTFGAIAGRAAAREPVKAAS